MLFFSSQLWSKEIRTNSVTMEKAPKWLKRVRVDKVTDRVQSKLEWSTRRIHVYWYDKQSQFEKIHSLGPTASAVAIKTNKKQSIHLGPNVNTRNFDQIFGHELVHIIFFQKYKGAIPRWLEEGFANHLSRRKKVNYKWLVKQKWPEDIKTMSHPFKGSTVSVKFHYLASQGLVEMIDKKCDLDNLLRLSVERKMKDYIKSYCNIPDVHSAFKKWVDQQSKN